MVNRNSSGINVITQQRLKDLLHYDAVTGLFTWRIKRKSVNPGDVAGCLLRGYVVIRVDGKGYKAHRLAWLYMTGKWPDQQIDHKDTIKTNNRFDNLRDVTPSGNKQNMRRAPSSNKTSGLLGVSFNKIANKFKAEIRVGGEKKHLGYFICPEEAHEAYLSAKRKLHQCGTI